MGFALAAAAAGRGAQVTLVAGPVQLRTPRGVRRIDVDTGAEMHEAVAGEFPSARVLVPAAAVADFAPAVRSAAKIKRDAIDGDAMTLSLVREPRYPCRGSERNGGIRSWWASPWKPRRAKPNARKKLAAKNLDMIVLNIHRGRRGGVRRGHQHRHHPSAPTAARSASRCAQDRTWRNGSSIGWPVCSRTGRQVTTGDRCLAPPPWPSIYSDIREFLRQERELFGESLLIGQRAAAADTPPAGTPEPPATDMDTLFDLPLARDAAVDQRAVGNRRPRSRNWTPRSTSAALRAGTDAHQVRLRRRQPAGNTDGHRRSAGGG